MRSTFVVGRLNRTTSELVLRTQGEAPLSGQPFPGPWRLRAVVGTPAARLGQKKEGPTSLQAQTRGQSRSQTRSQSQTRVLPFPGVER